MQLAALMLIAASYLVDNAHTTAGFAVKHLMVATVRGQFDTVAGKVEIDDADLTRSRIDVTIEAASVNTRNAKRDENLRGADFFDVAKYPLITFRSSRFEKAADGRLLAIGDLTIHGVTRPITLTVDSIAPPSKAPWGTTVRGATAIGKLFRKDFGLVWNKTLETGGVAVGDEVELTIDAEVVKETKAAAN
jgi:polyisoprenoid-binding protein YceI